MTQYILVQVPTLYTHFLWSDLPAGSWNCLLIFADYKWLSKLKTTFGIEIQSSDFWHHLEKSIHSLCKSSIWLISKYIWYCGLNNRHKHGPETTRKKNEQWIHLNESFLYGNELAIKRLLKPWSFKSSFFAYLHCAQPWSKS